MRYHLDMDEIKDNHLVHPSLVIPAYGQPDPPNVPGKVYNAVRLDGQTQYLDIGNHLKDCLGSPKLCNHGFTASLWANFRSLQDNAYYFSSGGGLTMYYDKGKLHISIYAADKHWEVKSANLKTDTWYFVEFTWHLEKGLQLYINNKLVDEHKAPAISMIRTPPSDSSVLVGKSNAQDGEGVRTKFGDFVVDELEFWFRDRDNLIAFEHILRGNMLVQPSLSSCV